MTDLSKKIALFLPAFILAALIITKNITHNEVRHNRIPASGFSCTDTLISIVSQGKDQKVWASLDDVFNFSEINPMDASVLRDYFNSIPKEIQQRLLRKFQAQDKAVTLNDLDKILDLHKINGACK